MTSRQDQRAPRKAESGTQRPALTFSGQFVTTWREVGRFVKARLREAV
jgi:hypothetical protein